VSDIRGSDYSMVILD